MVRFSFVLAWILCTKMALCQCSLHPVTLSHQSDAAFPLPDECMSAMHDVSGRPYVYVAGKERGLLVYDVSSLTTPALVDSVKITDLDTMEVMSLYQDGNYLYLALGNIFVNSSMPGMAIIDVSSPGSPSVKSVWKYPVQSGGAGVVRVEGNYAYLGAMRRGLMILDVSVVISPVLVSVFKPSILFPNPVSPDSLKYNARGMAVRNSIVYLCDDAGGIRVINAWNKALPVETGHYSNPAVYNRPRAYNNVVLYDTLLYVAADYCGMEVLSVADTSGIWQVGWWNPWHCESPSNTWFNSRGHTNELQYDSVCNNVFLSSGKSEIDVVNVSNPASPDSCTKYTTAGGNVGVWGLGLYQNQLYACYIYVPLGIPFLGTWSGMKLITWSGCPSLSSGGMLSKTTYSISPNPGNERVRLQVPSLAGAGATVRICDVEGKKVFAGYVWFDSEGDAVINTTNLIPGVYSLSVISDQFAATQKLLIAH